MAILQRFQVAPRLTVKTILHRADAIPGEGVVEGAFADLVGVDQTREQDVRLDTAVLRAFAGNAIELGAGQLDLAVAQVGQCLDGALAERAAADHQAATVILDRAGEDLRGGSGKPVDQHRQRTFVGHPGVGIAVEIDASAGIADLYGGAPVDEQADHRVGFLERAAAVIAQIEHDAFDVLRLELVDLLGHVPGGAAVVGLARLPGVEVDVECRHGDDADLVRRAVTLDLFHPAMGGLILELDGISRDPDGVRAGHVDGLGRDDVESHRRAFRATNQVDHFIETHADHVDHVAVFVLADGNNAIRRLQCPGLVGGAAGYQARYLDVLAVALQQRADPFQREAHLDIEGFALLRGKVFGMRVDRAGDRCHQQHEHVFGVGLAHAIELIGVAVVERLLDLLGRLVAQEKRQGGVLQPFVPELVERSLAARPRRVFPVERQALVAGVGVVDALIDLVYQPLEPGFHAILIV